METLSHAVGRDPVVDRAVYRVAQSIADFGRTTGTEQAHAEALVDGAYSLYVAADRLVYEDSPPTLYEFRRAIRDLLDACEEAARQSSAHAVDTRRLSLMLDDVVRVYRVFELDEEASIFDERMGGRP